MQIFKVGAVTMALFGAIVTLGSEARAQATPSGLLLGVWVVPNGHGLRVQSLIPGYSAVGRIFPGDVIRAITDGQVIYPINSLAQIEMAKSAIGPSVRSAVEIYRPGQGKVYLSVTFEPVTGPNPYYPQGAVPVMESKFQTERERPGAARMFENARTQQPTQPLNGSGDSDAADLFRQAK